MADADEAARRDNGLRATSYVALTDVRADLSEYVLTALRRARIAAYVDAGAGDRLRLFVAADERTDARTIVAAAVRGLAATQQAVTSASPETHDNDAPTDAASHRGSGAADTDAAFAALVANWHVDTVAAVRDAERDLTREDADWRQRLARPSARDEVPLDEDHYVPPAPPPLPRLARPTVAAIVVLVASIMVLGLGAYVGLADQVTLVLGIGGLLVAAGILLSRVREQRRDDDDDGSAV